MNISPWDRGPRGLLMGARNSSCALLVKRERHRSGARLDGHPDLHHIGHLVGECFASEDYVEGCRAVMEKRKPVFKGR